LSWYCCANVASDSAELWQVQFAYENTLPTKTLLSSENVSEVPMTVVSACKDL